MTFLDYRFKVEIEGIVSIAFSEIGELSNETEVVTYKEGGRNDYIHKFADHTDYKTIVLKRGMGLENFLYSWRQDVIDGKMKSAKRYGIITYNYNKDDTSCANESVWAFYNAWPSKLTIGRLNAMSKGEVTFESLELVVERFERIK
jgi:phage tail-like protein